MKNSNGIVIVSNETVKQWTPAMEQYVPEFASLSNTKKQVLAGMAQRYAMEFNLVDHTGKVAALEAESFLAASSNTSNVAPDVANPGDGSSVNNVGTGGTKGSGDPQYLVGICIAIAAKTIGLELVQTIPATSQNVVVDYLDVVYNGGDIDNEANTNVYVLSLTFDEGGYEWLTTENYAFRVAGSNPETFILASYRKKDRNGAYIFEVTGRITATNTTGTLSAVAYIADTNLALNIVGGEAFVISADMTTVTAIVPDATQETVATADNTKAVENYVSNQTTQGLRRTLTRSEADAGTDRELNLELYNESYTVGNRTLTGHISRLQYKRLAERGIDSVPYLTAAMKNEVSQEINWQIISACRSYGISNALKLADEGVNFNTYIGPKAVATKAWNALKYASEITDKDGNTPAFPAIQNLLATMEYENIQSVGTAICMIIKNAAYAVGTNSRYGDADACVVPSHIAGYLGASTAFTKLSEYNATIDSKTGAKLVGDIDGIKVYVDVQMPQGAPFVTVLRTNQDVTIDVPGITGEDVLVPGLAYIVKDIISSTEIVPEGTGGKKIIMDSETELVAIGENPEAGYLTFAIDLDIPGLK